jgi:hypothetical protein
VSELKGDTLLARAREREMWVLLHPSRFIFFLPSQANQEENQTEKASQRHDHHLACHETKDANEICLLFCLCFWLLRFAVWISDFKMTLK